MGNTTVWDVYLKTQEMRCSHNTGVPIDTIAAKLAIDADIAEECAMLLQKLDLINFNTERKEIMLPHD